MRNTYYLLRHGENTYQVQRKDYVYPKEDGDHVRLTKKGIAEVKNSLRAIKQKIDVIYSSDFHRTRETSGIAAKILGVKVINFDKRLRDINVGIFHGKKKEEFYKFVGYKKRTFSTRLPEGESWNDLRKRTNSFIKEIDKKNMNKNILIVGHGDPLWIFEGIVKKKTDKRLLHDIFVKNTFIKTGELRKLIK
jgi:broad specificity phosphatase PhoE